MDAGINSASPTQFGLTPVILNSSIHGLRGIYRWVLFKNIYPHLCVLISTGKTKDKSNRTLDISHEQLISLAIDTLKESVDQGYEYIGPTPFPEGLTCEYLRIGLYVDDSCDVLLCCGRVSGALGNVKHDSPADIWMKSQAVCRGFLRGHGCPWKERDGTMPRQYYEVVHAELLQYISQTDDKAVTNAR